MTILPDADWRRAPGLLPLIAVLGDGDTTRFVGGAVRDTLWSGGGAVSDIDIGTRLRPDAVIARLNAAGIKTVPTGLAHGTITAISQGLVVEITTLRRDVATDGRHAAIAFTDDWRADAARRDFTINALAADPASGAVFDWFGGIDDLAAGRVRFIGAPLERIAEDHLRILRFFRFYARFGRGGIDDAGYDACAVRANDLMALSRERIADELLKLLSGADPVDAIGLMLARRILRPVLPEITDAAPLKRLIRRERAFDIAGDPLRRLAALIGADGPRAEAIGTRLRLSKARVKRLRLACAPMPSMSPAALCYRVGTDVARDRLLLNDGTAAALADVAQWQPRALPISGGALITRGVPVGPLVAHTLARIERDWVDAGFPTGTAFDAIVDAALLSSAH
jgi:poly(A) polymerase